MLCEKCNKKLATVFITKVINDQKSEQMLCFDCAKEEHAFPAGLEGAVSVDSLLKGLFGGGQISLPNPAMENIRCPVCGMTMALLAERGRFGCNECYKVFGEAASRTVKHIHGRKRHIGKIPKRAGGVLGIKRKLLDLRAKLETHVLREEYEEAAMLRDEIRRMEKDMPLLPEVKDDVK